MQKVRVLVVDDSVVFRSQIKGAFESIPWIEVVGVASNGKLALEKIKNIQVDLITLDLEMPEMNGIETLKQLKAQKMSQKVIVFASVSQEGAEKTLEALDLGASDFIAKPSALSILLDKNKTPIQIIQESLAPKIQSLFNIGDKYTVSENTVDIYNPPAYNWEVFLPKAIVIGCSTGGPTALEKIFNQIHGPFSCPVFIVQHMPPVFTATLAERIQKISGVQTKEATHGEIIKSNCIYIAPGNYHMEIIVENNVKKISLNQNAPENSVRPAVDPLFRTAESVYHNQCLGIILTGMGRDGLIGARALRKSGNPVVIQSRESCVVFGMPGALYEDKQYDEMRDLDGIRNILQMTFENKRKAIA